MKRRSLIAFVVGTLQVCSMAEGAAENLEWTFNAPRATGYNIIWILPSQRPEPLSCEAQAFRLRFQ